MAQRKQKNTSTIDPARVRKIILIDSTLAFIITAIVMVGVFALINSRTYQLFGTLVASVDTNEKVIALTLDDGPLPGTTDKILDVLEQQDIKATFYLIGKEIERHPAHARSIIEAGHEIGNHTYSHRELIFKPARFIKNDIEKADVIYRSFGYNKPTTFRPPYGDKLAELPRYLDSTNRTTIMWSIAPDEDEDAESIKNFIIDKAHPGGIILLHPVYDHRRASLDAIGPAVKALKDKGYRFVTVSELLQYRQ